jgi:hypothetical protein
MNDVTNNQRALWMVLITSLAAPFFASLIHVAMTLASPLFDFALPPRDGRPIGEVAMAAFAWGAIPATVAALGLIPYVLQTGTYTWLNAAIAGVLAFFAAALIVPFGSGPAMPLLAFLAGLIAIGMRVMLIRGQILKP